MTESDEVDGAHSGALMCHRVIVRDESHERAVHMQISTIGIDLAKNVFQVHGVDAAEKLVLKKQLRRSQVLEFFSIRRVSSAWRRAPRRTSGLASSRSLGTMCGLCPQAT